MTSRLRNVPRATYRIQLHAGFTFDDARAILEYLDDLGISHLFCSPVLQAAPGSLHGYDVVDHGHVSRELGGDEGWLRLTDAVQERGMGIVLDIVPNHMAIGEQNRLWWDVLTYGPASRFASYFDVEWSPPEARLANMILLPVLPDHYGRVLEEGGIRLAVREGKPVVTAAERSFPLDPATIDSGPGRSIAATVDALNADIEALDDLLGKQHYRLAFWRAASRDLGYRRFFDIDGLIGLRVEDERVFAATHVLPLRWLREGRISGLRIDHPDGLRDPAGYFERLRAAAPDAWIVAEKILASDETLPGDWLVDGTTGYGFASLATGIHVAPTAEPEMTAIWETVADVGPEWEVVAARARSEVLATVLGSDVNRLTDLFVTFCEKNRRFRDFTRHELHHALREIAAAIPVYRTYVRAADRHVGPADLDRISSAVATARARRPDLDPDLFELLGAILRLELDGQVAGELAMRFQQLTPAAMAKGIEDTAFYRYHRLVALNEVGGDPGRFGVSVDAFHSAMTEAAAEWPAAMLALSTHDTKRSADVRARIATLTRNPATWRAFVAHWMRGTARFRSADGPTDADVYLLLQTIIGAWPIDVDRASAYLAKASKEAKLRTSWMAPDPTYDAALDSFVRASLSDDAAISEIEAFVASFIDEARRAALIQVVLELTAPGIPDMYQGSELWDLSLVDPDNRRPVDYDVRRRLLEKVAKIDADEAWAQRADGVPKLWLVQRLLALRARRASSFAPGSTYEAISAHAEDRGAVLAFVRGGAVAVVAVIGVGGSAEIQLPPGDWTGLDDRTHSGRVAVADLQMPFGVAVLERGR